MSTLRNQVLDYVAKVPDRTATEIARAIKAKSSSVSSLLLKLCQAGVCTRVPRSTRGGYAYSMTPAPKERLKSEDVYADVLDGIPPV